MFAPTQNRSVRGAAALIAVTMSTGTAGASHGPIEAIFSEAPGHPTALVPGALDELGDPIVVEWKAMEILTVSPNGSDWLIKGRNHGGADIETMTVQGSGATGSVVLQEGQPVPDGEPGEIIDFFGSGGGSFDSGNAYAITLRARGGDSTTKQKGLLFDGAVFSVVRAESDPALGLLDLPPNPSGDELFGNSIGSFHLLDDGRIGSHDTTIQNIHSSRRPAVFYGATSFKQTGVDLVEGASPGIELWDGMDSNAFYTTPDGTTWFIRGDTDGNTASDDVLVVNDVVVIREGTSLPDAPVTVDGIFTTKLNANGDWHTRGDDAADDDWAVRNGVTVARTGTALFAGSGEAWADVFLAFTGDSAGNWVLAGRSDSADEATNDVLVLNGAEVIAREGDPVDLDGNGSFDDDAFIGRGNLTSSAFHPDDIALSEDGTLWFFASLRDGAGNDLGEFGSGGDAFLRIQLDLGGAPCPADFDGSGDVGFADLLQLLALWGPCAECDEDLDGNGDVGFGDLLALLAAWGPCA